jgi:hypothetical protein
VHVTVRARITGANEFTAAGPCVTFEEVLPASGFGPGWAPVLYAVAYNSQGTASTNVVQLRPQNGASNADEIIELIAPTDAANTLDYACGWTGRRIVPREFGVSKTGTATNGFTNTTLTGGEPYRLFFLTTSKDNAGTLTVQYGWEQIGK